MTSRYMVAGREWARAHPSNALDGLRNAVVPWTGRFQLTLWQCHRFQPWGGTKERPGTGQEFSPTLLQYAKFLEDNAVREFQKGKAAIVSLGRSDYRGRSDAECLGRSGFLLDSDGCGGWDQMRRVFREVGLSFVGQLRPVNPSNHHIEIFCVKELVPERDEDGGVADWKTLVYQPILGWLLGVLSELGGLTFNLAWDGEHASAKYAGYDSCTDQLLQANYFYTRRPEDPPGHVPVIDHNLGGALDFDKFLEATEFRELPPSAIKKSNVKHGARRTRVTCRASSDNLESRTTSPIDLTTVYKHLAHLRKPESRDLLAPVLAGRSYAARGTRDHTLWRIACVLAFIAPDNSPEMLAEVLRPSLTKMAAEPNATPSRSYVEIKLRLAAHKIARAQKGLPADDDVTPGFESPVGRRRGAR